MNPIQNRFTAYQTNSHQPITKKLENLITIKTKSDLNVHTLDPSNYAYINIIYHPSNQVQNQFSPSFWIRQAESRKTLRV